MRGGSERGKMAEKTDEEEGEELRGWDREEEWKNEESG